MKAVVKSGLYVRSVHDIWPQSMPSILFTAVIGASNEPLYIRSFEPQNAEKSTSDVRHHFIAHMALDYILREPTWSETTRTHELLLVHDDIAVYGMSTNTNAKFLVGVDAHDNLNYDVAGVLEAIQQAYIGWNCNPFKNDTSNSQMIESKQFDRMVGNAVESWQTAK